jgi:tryptophan synthase alpha chain
MIAHSASGFLYYVAVLGVTGPRTQLSADLEAKVRALYGVTDLPIGVGFGISTPEQAAEVARYADAVVVGSAISQLIEKNAGSEGVVTVVGEFAGALKAAIRAARTGDSATAAQ